MTNNDILRAAIEDAHRSDGAHSLRKLFPTGTNRSTQLGDYYMGLGRCLFQLYRPLIRKEDHEIIRELYRQVQETSMEIVSDRSSPLRKFVKAIEYKKLANVTYHTIKRASGHDVNDEINKRARAIDVTAGAVYPDADEWFSPDAAVLESYSEEELRAVTSLTPTDLFGPPSSESLNV